MAEVGVVFDARSVTADYDGAFFEGDGISRLRSALSAGTLPQIEIDGQRVGAPIARPSAVLCVGLNYHSHARELGKDVPTEPLLFMKTPNTVVGPNDEIVLPKGSMKTDWKVELAVVIGRRCSYLDSPSDSEECIAGFTITNDVSEREFSSIVVDSGAKVNRVLRLIPSAPISSPQMRSRISQTLNCPCPSMGSADSTARPRTWSSMRTS